MKKVFIVFGVLFVVLVLLIFAFTACDIPVNDNVGVTASAEDAFPSSTRIVRPNLVSQYNFFNTASITSAPVDTDVLVSTNATYNIDDYGVIHFTSSGYLWFAFHTVSSYSSTFYLTGAYLGNRRIANVIIHDFSSTYSDLTIETGFNRVNSVTDLWSVNPSWWQIPDSWLNLDILISIPVDTDFYALLFKYESDRIVNFRGTGVQYYRGFTGIPVEGYSYPRSGNFNSWDGLVLPNLLNNSDFYYTPYYVDSLTTSTALPGMWCTSAPSSSFSYDFEEYEDYIYNYGYSTLSLPSNTDTVLIYRFDQDVIFYQDTPLIFTLGFWSSVSGSISLVKNNDTVDFVDFIGSPNYQEFSLLCSGAEFSFDLFIVITFSGGVSSSDVVLWYSKLEYGSLFTGYVYPEHDSAFFVRDNYIANYQFDSVPVYYDTLEEDIAPFDTWYSSYNFVYRNDPTSGSLVIDNSSNASSEWLYYHTSVRDDMVDDNFTLTFYMRSDSPLLITVSDFYIYGSDIPDADHHILASGYYFIADTLSMLSLYFDALEDIYIFVSIPADSIVYLNAVKLENGDSFTGFCPNYLLIFDDAYDAGYDVGYAAGIEVYGSSTYTLPFNNVEGYQRLDIGWSNFGFSVASDLLDATFSLYSYFYADKDFTVLSSGTFWVVDDNDLTSGVGVFISRDADFDIGEEGNYIRLLIFEDYSLLTISDTDFPGDFNPVSYPNYRVVVLTVNRGLTLILESYSGAIYDNGYRVGQNAGYERGFNDGKVNGYNLATDVIGTSGTGGWFGFISAFVDVPVKVLSSMLDFDFFGFNLFNIVKIMVLISLFFMVVRLVTKGKLSA